MESETTSVFSRQSSGIRALPSNDDDDNEIYDDFDENFDNEISNSVEQITKTDEINQNLNGDSATTGSNDSNSSSFSSGNIGGSVNGVEFDNSVVDPDYETLEYLVGSAQNDVNSTGSVVDSGGKVSVPVAKVSGEVDDDENEVGSGGEEEAGHGEVETVVPRVRVLGEGEGEEEEVEEEWGEPLEEPELETSNVHEGAPEEKGVDSLGMGNGDVVDKWDGGDAVVDSINVDVVEAVRSGVAVVAVDNKKGSGVEPLGEGSVGELSVEVSSGVDAENVGVMSTNEDDSVKESAGEQFVDVGSASTNEEDSIKDSDGEKAFAVGVTSTNEDDSLIDSTNADVAKSKSESAVAESKEESQVSELEVGDTAVVEEPASGDSEATYSADVKYTDEGDAVVGSINVDAVEAARSRVAIVGELAAVKDSEPVGESSVVKDVAPVLKDSVTEKYVTKDPNVVKTKSEGESDAVVDGIDVNVVEAIRCGAAVVGESVAEGMKTEKREVEAPVVENVKLVNEFEPLADQKLSEVVDVEQAQTNGTEVPQSIEILGLLNTDKTESETEFVSNEREISSELQFSGGQNEQVQPDHVDYEPDASDMVEKASNRSYASVLVDGPDVATSDENQLEQTETANPDTEVEVVDRSRGASEKGDDEDSGTDGEGDLIYSANGNSSRQAVEKSETHDGMIDGQVVTESDEGDSNEEGDGNEPFDSAALAALLRAATGAGTDPGTITVRSQDGSRLFSLERPVGLEPSLRATRPGTGPNSSSFFSPTNIAPPSEENLSEEDKKKLQFLQQLKVKFLRLAQRVGFTAEHSLAAQVLYKLTVFAGRSVSPSFSLDNAKQTVMQLESEGDNDLDFSLHILVLGKSGVGKSAIINSIFGEEKVKINAFEPETTSVTEVNGTVDGVKIRFIDAPGLKSSAMEQGFNRRVLASVKKLTKKYPPDVMFYVDRLDSQTRDLNDLPLLKTISNSLGTSIWRNAIITLTHASSAPPDGPSGTPLSYEVFVAQRSHIVQQSIGQAVGEMRLMNLNMMNPVSLIENHPACRKNREGQKILPNGQAWKPQLMLLCYSVKILSEASAASKPQDAFDPRKLFGFRTRSPPLPYLLSSLLQPRAHPKLSADQGGDTVDSDIDLDDVSDSDQEEEDEYDQLPPFKPLKRNQLAKLSGDQKKAYFEEYDYRVKLLQRKQLREELRNMREVKRNGKNSMDSYGEAPDDIDAENGAPPAVPVPLPDMTLPPSFDSDNPAYRYRFLEPTSQFLARPVLDPHGWDHDCGYEGVNVEHNMGIAERFPASFTVQVNKDKKDFNVHLDSAVSAKHGENGSSLLGFDVQTIGKQYAYIVRGESKFKNLKNNKTGAGVTVTFLGENVATGVKVEDQIILGKRLVLVGSTGTVRSQKDAAYGANLEIRLREADYPIGQEQSSFTLSLMKWRGDLAIGSNLQSQISLGRNSKMTVRAALNNKMSGQITLRTSSSDHLSLALAGLMPIAMAIYQKLSPGDVSENYAIY